MTEKRRTYKSGKAINKNRSDFNFVLNSE